jgi:prepilin-type N-terminal cleavage/methylation domain-containing protein
MRGVTLVELVVALCVFGLLTAFVGIAVGSVQPPRAEGWKADLRRARDSAIRTGQPVIMTRDSGYRTLLLPDGRSIGVGLDPLTSEVVSAQE